MDTQQFDDLSRSLTATRSRRGALRLLAGAAIGLVAARPAAGEAAGRCPKGKERCDGRCLAVCKGLKIRNRRTCACDCPQEMTDCGKTCIGQDKCCPGLKSCGGGCIAADVCCPHTEKECPDGSCLAKDAGACCAGVEVPCGSAPGGCCNSFAGEVCSDDGCCNELFGEAVCGGKCVDTKTDPNNCGDCGVKCGSRTTCQDGVCRGPDRAKCETCVGGEVKPGVTCGDHCCSAGAECYGGGCCAPGKCDSVNGQTCCHKVVDNRPYCQRM